MFINFCTPVFYRGEYVILVVTEVKFRTDCVTVEHGYAFDKDTGADVDWRDVYESSETYIDRKVAEYIEENY